MVRISLFFKEAINVLSHFFYMTMFFYIAHNVYKGYRLEHLFRTLRTMELFFKEVINVLSHFFYMSMFFYIAHNVYKGYS